MPATRAARAIMLTTIVTLIGLAWTRSAPGAPSDPPAPPTNAEPADFAAVLRHVAAAADGEAWQKPEWRDPMIEGWLERLVEQVNAATPNAPKRMVPARFAAVTPRPDVANAPPLRAGAHDMIIVDGRAPVVVGKDAPATAPAAGPASAPAAGAPAADPDGAKQPAAPVVHRVAPVSSGLVIGHNVQIVSADHSIILADGNARVSFASNCVIIARGAVYVAHGHGNVLAAGQFVHVSHDGMSRPARNPNGRGFVQAPGRGIVMEVQEPGSIVASGSTINISHAAATVCLANDLERISNATGCTFINPPAKREIENENQCRDVAAPEVRMAHTGHALDDQVQVDWIAPGQGAVFRLGDHRYAADMNKPILDQAGKPVAALKGWSLTFCDEEFALFTNGREDFGDAAARRPPE